MLKFTAEQRNRYNYEYRIAQVISANSDPNSRTINIDIGENADIKPGMAVTSQDGLVGVISHVSAYTSTVNLLTSMDANDPNSNAIAATAVGKEDTVFGMIESFDPKTGMFKMTKISEESDIKKVTKLSHQVLSIIFRSTCESGKSRKLKLANMDSRVQQR